MCNSGTQPNAAKISCSSKNQLFEALFMNRKINLCFEERMKRCVLKTQKHKTFVLYDKNKKLCSVENENTNCFSRNENTNCFS
jgi:hypothetical protein